ncbi:hypothetical protein HDV03_002493 [Kappamyces sp. JEL0829]|nr:hypothetical protein HDV03_002493 [Kappamyces sp. JEL0829]
MPGITPMELERAMQDQFSLLPEPQIDDQPLDIEPSAMEKPVDAKRSVSLDSWDSGDEDSNEGGRSLAPDPALEEERLKRRKFNELRAQHYNMKDVLTHARELVENEALDPHYSDPNAYDPEPPSDDFDGIPDQAELDDDDDM